MAYLTFAEFKAISGREIDEQEFERLFVKASALFDVLTRYFYEKTSFENDYAIRKRAVKRSISAQIEYFIDTGETTFEGLNTAPQSITIGRTSITKGSNYNASGVNEKKGLASAEMMMHLSGTGLLNRSVGCWYD